MTHEIRTFLVALAMLLNIGGCATDVGPDVDLESEPSTAPEGGDVVASTAALTADGWTCSTTSLGGGRWSRFCAQGSTGCVATYSGGRWSSWDCNN